jgi:D-beta-D-heptose 7-phosphate kinase/D-beta-D-heptose 1-phosphate adenosyltransferase
MNKKYDIIILSGGFDPPHVGHIRMIRAAQEYADMVFVGCNSDRWLIRKKGYKFMTHEDRSELIESIKGVHAVIPFEDDDNTAIKLIEQITKLYDPRKFRIAFGNGGDRKESNTPEQSFCESCGINMVWELGGGKVRSSSELVKHYSLNKSF